MRKLIVALLCAALLFACALPAGLAASESIELEVNGKRMTLMFDASELFSNVTEGTVQASFYTYLENSNDLYELYMIFPRDVQPGATLTPDYARQNAPETSVVLIVTTNAGVDYYFAGQAEDADDTDYTMTFDAVTDSDNSRTYSGTLSASMVGMSSENERDLKALSFSGARFSFTMPLNAGRQDDANPSDTLPPETGEPFGNDFYDPFAPGAEPTPAPTRESYRV